MSYNEAELTNVSQNTPDNESANDGIENTPVTPVRNFSDQPPPLTRGDGTSKGSSWTLFGRPTQQDKIVYFSQVAILYVIILFCLINLTIQTPTSERWGNLLSIGIGLMCPNPQFKKPKHERNRS